MGLFYLNKQKSVQDKNGVKRFPNWVIGFLGSEFQAFQGIPIPKLWNVSANTNILTKMGFTVSLKL